MTSQITTFLLLISGLVFNARAFSNSKTDTITTDGQAFFRRLTKPYVSQTSNFRSVFFVSDLHDISRSHPQEPMIPNCTDQPIILPQYEFSFDTLEYYAFRNSKNLSFQDSLQYLQGNMLYDRWHRIYIREDGVCSKVEKLGIDINIDFGRVLSTTYYLKDSICLITDSCFSEPIQQYLRIFVKKGERWFESSYIIYPDYVIRKVELE